MFKNIICLILISALLAPGLKAHPYDMSRERFVHLSEQEKEELIILTMEMMVEMESNYEQFVRVHGNDPELTERYSILMKALGQFILSSAYASDKVKKEWSEYAQNFTEGLSAGAPGDKCFFAGWVSRVQEVKIFIPDPNSGKKPEVVDAPAEDPKKAQKKKDAEAKVKGLKERIFQLTGEIATEKSLAAQGKPGAEDRIKSLEADLAKTKQDLTHAEMEIKNNSPGASAGAVAKAKPKKPKGTTKSFKMCVHPSQIDDKNAPEKKAYEEFSKPCRSATSKQPQISCNPAIFGFKKESDKSLFCVDASQYGSENSSHNCMKKSLGMPQEPDSDSKEKRIEALKAELSKPDNEKYVKSVYEFMMKACVCKDVPEGLHEKYLERIRPHRTCYAMMEMMGETLTCSTPESPANQSIDLTFFEALKDHTKKKTNIHRKKQSKELDDYFEKYLKDMQKTEKYGYICEGKEPPKPVVPEEPNPEPKVYSCKVEECEKKMTPAAAAATVGTTVASAGAESSKKSKEQDKEGAEAPGWKPADGEQAPAAAPAKSQLVCKKITVTEAANAEVNFAAGKSIEGLEGEKVKFDFKDGDKDESVECELPILPKEETIIPQCSATLAADGTEATVTVAITPEGLEAQKYEWSLKPKSEEKGVAKFDFDKAKGMEPVKVTVSLKKGEMNFATVCATEKVEPEKKDEDPKLELTAGETSKYHQKAEAKVTGNTEGWSLVWFTKGPAPKVKKSEAKDEPKFAGDSEAADAEGDEGAKEEEPEEEEEEEEPKSKEEKKKVKEEAKAKKKEEKEKKKEDKKEEKEKKKEDKKEEKEKKKEDKEKKKEDKGKKKEGTDKKKEKSGDDKAAAARTTEEEGEPFTLTKNPAPEKDTVQRPRSQKDYEICAKLVKGKKTVGESCIKVPALEDVALPEDKDKKSKSGILPGVPQGGQQIQFRPNHSFSVGAPP